MIEVVVGAVIEHHRLILSFSTNHSRVECLDGSAPTDADFGPESNPESRSFFDDPDPDPDYDDDDDLDSDSDSDNDLDPHPDDDFDSDSDLSLIQTPIPTSTLTPTPTQAQILIRIPTKPVSYISSAAQIMTSPLTTPTHGPDCEYCGDPRHTRETCFKLHGYPDWWATLKDRGQRNTTNNGTGYGFHTSAKIDSRSWIIDSGAIDHMTFDPDDFLNATQPRRTCIANANGVTYPVTGAGTVALSSSLTLSNTLLDIHTKKILGRGTKRGGLYYVDDFSPGMANSVTHPFDSKQKQIWLWHRRLGHPSFSYMKHLIPDLFSGFKDSDFTCDTCILAKSHRVPYPLSTNKCTTPFTLIHSDVWGPSPITAPSGNKNEVFSRFQSFHKQMKTQFNAQIQILRSDNGGEFTPQQNGVAKRKNRHLLETARALLIGAHVPHHHWDDAIVTAVHLINRMPSGVLTFKTPLQKGYRCYHPLTRRTYVTLDVTFLESELFFHDPSSNSTLQGEIRSEEQN
ncbi:unnamed protein product [Prunus armeniaca]